MKYESSNPPIASNAERRTSTHDPESQPASAVSRWSSVTSPVNTSGSATRVQPSPVVICSIARSAPVVS